MKKTESKRPVLRSDTTNPVESTQIMKKDNCYNEEPSCSKLKLKLPVHEICKQGTGSKRVRREENTSERKVEEEYFQFDIDILYGILSRLPIEDLVRCRSVCKMWQLVTMDPAFIMMQMHLSNSRPPCFISQPLSTRFFNNIAVPYTDFFIVSENMPLNRLYLLDTEEGKARHMPLSEDIVKKYRLLFSYNGLICAAQVNYANPLILCNPVTNESVRLPRIGHVRNVHAQRVGLCYESARQKHVLVRVFESVDRKNVDFFIRASGEPSYRSLEHPPCVNDCEIWSAGTVYWNHAFHWGISKKHGKSGNECILSFDTVHETFQIISFPRETSALRDLNLELLVLDGQLTLIELYESKMELWKMTGNKVGEFSLVHTGETYETHIRWGTLFRCSFLARLTQKMNLVKIRYGTSGCRILSHFAFATKDMSQFTPFKVNGLPDDSLTLPYNPSFVSVHSIGLSRPSIINDLVRPQGQSEEFQGHRMQVASQRMSARKFVGMSARKVASHRGHRMQVASHRMSLRKVASHR